MPIRSLAINSFLFPAPNTITERERESRESERRRGMGPNSPAPPPRSFYKIILPSIIHDHKLRIPEDFAKAYENELSSFAKLIVPNGQVFRVKLEKAAKMLWLHHGWKKFAEHLSIRCGFFLVFNYVGNSKFKVHIFDLTATEIEYPENSMGSFEEPKNGSKSKVLQRSGRKRGRPSRQPHSSMSKPSPVPSQDTIFNECSLQGVKRKRCFHSVLPTLFRFAPEFAMRIDNYGKCIPKSFLNSLRSNSQYETRNKQRKLEVFSGTTNLKDVSASEGTSKIIVLSDSRTESENGELIPEDNTSLVENSRFSNESDLQNCENAADKKSQQFAEDSEDRRLTTPSNKDENQVKVKQEVGEELIGVNDSNICPTRSMIQEKEKAVNAALMLKLRNPYFMNILKQHNVDLSFILHVPAYFGNKYLSDDTQFLKLEGPDGKHLEVSCFSDGEVKYLSRGWVMFVKEYNLVEGDVCIFELIQLDDVVLKVHIFRARQTSLDQGSDNSGLKRTG